VSGEGRGGAFVARSSFFFFLPHRTIVVFALNDFPPSLLGSPFFPIESFFRFFAGRRRALPAPKLRTKKTNEK
jgi:hypothetical protein